jgi:hypothetical protein
LSDAWYLLRGEHSPGKIETGSAEASCPQQPRVMRGPTADVRDASSTRKHCGQVIDLGSDPVGRSVPSPCVIGGDDVVGSPCLKYVVGHAVTLRGEGAFNVRARATIGQIGEGAAGNHGESRTESPRSALAQVSGSPQPHSSKLVTEAHAGAVSGFRSHGPGLRARPHQRVSTAMNPNAAATRRLRSTACRTRPCRITLEGLTAQTI